MSAAESIVPLVDLRAQYSTLKSEVDAAIDGVLARGDFILGEELKLFEAEFAQYCGAKFGVGVGSGTDALHLACRALDIGPGDEVIMPAFTFVATALGISLSGATPVLVDVDPRTALIDAEAVARAVRPETRAIMPVHFYGQCVDMDPLLELAEQHGLRIIRTRLKLMEPCATAGAPARSVILAASASTPGKISAPMATVGSSR